MTQSIPGSKAGKDWRHNNPKASAPPELNVFTRVASLRVTIIFPVMLILFAVLSVGSILFSRYRQSRVVRESKKASGRQALGLFGFCQTDNGPGVSFPYFNAQIISTLGACLFYLICMFWLFPANIEDPKGFGVSALLYPDSLLILASICCLLLGFFQIWRRGDFGLSRVPLVTIRRVAIYICGMALYLAGLE